MAANAWFSEASLRIDPNTLEQLFACHAASLAVFCPCVNRERGVGVASRPVIDSLPPGSSPFGLPVYPAATQRAVFPLAAHALLACQRIFPQSRCPSCL